jgi:uncharacterized protein (DUF488 family)
MTTILTVGHSTHTAEHFLDLIQSAGVRVLVDVRTRPQSRWCPWFNRAALSSTLTSQGIRYEWRGKNLGGLAGNTLYEETIDEVVTWSSGGVAVMCSEGSPAGCHRSTLLTPSFTLRGAAVLHILPDGQLIPDSKPTPPLTLF